MGYSKEIYQQAQQVLAQRRQDAETAARLLHARMVAKYPQLPELERQLAASSLGVARVILEGRDVQARIAALRDENLHLQNQIAQLLEKEGETVTRVSADGITVTLDASGLPMLAEGDVFGVTFTAKITDLTVNPCENGENQRITP